MDLQNFLSTVHLLEKLKNTPRHCYSSTGRRESVAEHTWRISMMALFLKDEFPDADIDKVIRMCLIHDLGEIFTGDIPTFLKTSSDEELEETLLNRWVDSLPAPYCDEFHSLYKEMNELSTLESQIYKALDRVEAVISHNESNLDTWLPNEYDLQLTYGYENVAFSSYMKDFRDLVRQESLDLIEKYQKNC